MARVTVEDCTKIVASRFELVALAAQRAKSISAGGDVTVDRQDDKNAVIALREIAEKTVDVEKLREALVQNNQTKVNVDAYGIEENDNIVDEDISEAAEEMQALQPSVAASAPAEDDIYGGDDIEFED